MEDICLRLMDLRLRLGLSQVEFARPLGVTNAHISKIEKGKTVPSDSLIKLICMVYNINELWLKHGNPPMHIAEIESTNEDMFFECKKAFDDLFSRNQNAYIRNAIINAQMMFLFIIDSGINNDDQAIEYLKICESLFSALSDAIQLIRGGIPDPAMLSFSNEDIRALLEDYKIKTCKNIDSMISFFEPE